MEVFFRKISFWQGDPPPFFVFYMNLLNRMQKVLITYGLERMASILYVQQGLMYHLP